MDYIETNCTIEHNGKVFEASGAMVTASHIVAYCGDNGVLTDWHGQTLGTWRSVARWRVQSFVSLNMYQIEATVDGVVYTGRGFGSGMVYRGKRKAKQPMAKVATR